MRFLSAETLDRFSRSLFEAVGASPEEAATVSEVLVRANLSGHDSHGVIRIPQYCQFVRSGHIVPGAPVTTLRETTTTALFDAGWGFGQVGMTRALDVASERVHEVGLFAFGIHRCNHIGRLGHYAEIAASRGFVVLLTVNSTGSGASVAPFGGREPRLGTNPFCMAFPTQGDPILVDMTSSIVAEGKIRVKRNKGERLPPGWILDREGKPSTNPADFYGPPRGAILPFGGDVGHKGFALSMVAELLSGTLTAAGNVGEREGHVGNGVFCLLVNVEAFRPFDEFASAATRVGERVKDCPPFEGFAEVMLPGEPEARTRRERALSGVPVDDGTWEQLVSVAKTFSCPVPEG
jgi:uncharacterized oxidoreductase